MDQIIHLWKLFTAEAVCQFLKQMQHFKSHHSVWQRLHMGYFRSACSNYPYDFLPALFLALLWIKILWSSCFLPLKNYLNMKCLINSPNSFDGKKTTLLTWLMERKRKTHFSVVEEVSVPAAKKSIRVATRSALEYWSCFSSLICYYILKH